MIYPIPEMKSLLRRSGDVYFDSTLHLERGLPAAKVVKKDLLERLDALEDDFYWKDLLFDVVLRRFSRVRKPVVIIRATFLDPDHHL